MKTTKSKSSVIDELALAEASAWLARQDPTQVRDEAAFREWLAASPAHAEAFERINDVWELIPGAVESEDAVKQVTRHRIANFPRALAAVGAVMLLAIVATAWALFAISHTQLEVYQTAVGQQKTILLADGTRIVLNTNTEIAVRYHRQEREVWLRYGEALFHVEKDTRRPFVVHVRSQKIVDLGTIFDVRHFPNRVAITLLEGSVWVSDEEVSPQGSVYPIIMKPGQRLTTVTGKKPVLDRPVVRDVMAWRRGYVSFKNNTLAQAVASINRYNTLQIRITNPKVGALHVSGVFATDSPVQFATAVANLHGLHMRRSGDEILLEQ